MSAPIPKHPLVLSLALALPLIWCIAEIYIGAVARFAQDWLNPAFYAPWAGLRFATILLAVSSGILWGLAARADDGRVGQAYKLSLLPALYAFVIVQGSAAEQALKLALGVALAMALDYLFWKRGLAPHWWLHLRLPFAAVVIACLLAIGLAPEHLLQRQS